jgi:hypothetical protein
VVRITPYVPPGATWFGNIPIFPSPFVPSNKDDFDGTYALGSCTGTFINKNFILTAAHCFEQVALMYDPSTDESTEWITSNLWQIAFADENGNIIPNGGTETLKIKARTYANPGFSDIPNRRYPNAQNPTNLYFDSPYDIGLLYIDAVQNDGNLPADVDQQTWAVQREDESSLVNGWVGLGLYGYGARPNLPVQLQNSFAKPPGGFTQGATNGIVTTLSTKVTETPWPYWGLCVGDSGGPLFRTVNTGPFTVDQVIIAVNSAESPPATPGHPCADQMGAKSFWARVDVVIPWLVSTVQRWYPNFAPVSFPDGSDADSYFKFHGTACDTDCDCEGNEICENTVNFSYSPFQTSGQACGACLTPPIGDCGCVRGQCIPNPDADAGDDGGDCVP